LVAPSTSLNATATSQVDADGAAPRLTFAKIHEPLDVPNLLALQTDSFDWLVGNERWKARVEEALEQNIPGVATTSGLADIF
jgi:DNA-directed RNA polymerase subunit beta